MSVIKFLKNRYLDNLIGFWWWLWLQNEIFFIFLHFILFFVVIIVLGGCHTLAHFVFFFFVTIISIFVLLIRLFICIHITYEKTLHACIDLCCFSTEFFFVNVYVRILLNFISFLWTLILNMYVIDKKMETTHVIETYDCIKKTHCKNITFVNFVL